MAVHLISPRQTNDQRFHKSTGYKKREREVGLGDLCLPAFRNCGRRGCYGMQYEQLEFLSASFELYVSEKAVHWVSRRKPRDQRFQKSIVYKKKDILTSADFVGLSLDSTDCVVAMRYE